jgi:hypothetical protein
LLYIISTPQAPLLALFTKHKDSKGKQAKLKSPGQLQELLDIVRQLLGDMEARSAAAAAAAKAGVVVSEEEQREQELVSGPQPSIWQADHELASEDIVRAHQKRWAEV